MSPDGSSNCPIFIVGHPRSGTTLLRDMLRSHPAITIPYESHFIPAYFRGYGDPHSELAARRLGAKLLKLHWVQRWCLSIDPSHFSSCRAFRQVVSRLFQSWAIQEGKPRWGDKTPEYVTEIPTLAQLFPEAKFIHVIRDGRDVALSWMQLEFGAGNVCAAAESWKRLVTLGQSAGAKLPDDQYVEVRYERLVSQPEQTLRCVCEFIGEPYSPAVLVPNRLPPRLLPYVVGKRREPDISQVEIVGSNSQKWKCKMSREQRVLFESTAGDVLADLGYETEGETRHVSLAERAWWRCHSSAIQTARRLNLGNKAAWVPTHLKLRWVRWRSRLKSLARRLSSE